MMDVDSDRELDQENVDGIVPPENHSVQSLRSPSPSEASPCPEESVSSPDSMDLTGCKIRKLTLTATEVWDHLDKEEVKNKGGSVEIKARCKYCNDLISYDSSLGIYYLRLHCEDCITKITAKIRKEERTLPVKNREDVTFDQAVVVRSVVAHIITSELSFGMAETRAFLEFAKSLNPLFRPIPSRTVVNVVMKFFREEKPKLKSLLQALPGKICLSANLWKPREGDGFSYMCITAHYVDSSWKLNKRIISFPALEFDCSNRFEIFEAIYNSILDWNIGENVFTITLDNTVPTDVPERLKEVLPLSGSSLCKQLFYVPCGTYILNTIVQEGLEGFSHSIQCVRESIVQLVGSMDELRNFRELCKSEDVLFKVLPSDVPEHWNTTYLMLDAAIPYQRIFELHFSDSAFEHIPTALDWKNATVMRDILKVFYESTKLCSDSRYVASSAFIHQLSNICLVMSKYESDPSYEKIIANMKSKMKDYCGDIAPVLGMSMCVDPRYKVLFLEVCLEVIYGHEETHKSGGRLHMIITSLKELYEGYKQNLVGSDSESSMTEEADPTFAIYATRQKALSRSSTSELQWYLEQPSVKITDRETFDVLGWWKAQQDHYPVLSAMARDLLTVPVSSVPLHLSFTTSERELSEKRNILDADVVEASTCLKDWYEAEAGDSEAKLRELEVPNEDFCSDMEKELMTEPESESESD